MLRALAPVLFAIAMIVGLIGGSPAPSGAYQESASPAASPSPAGLSARIVRALGYRRRPTNGATRR